MREAERKRIERLAKAQRQKTGKGEVDLLKELNLLVATTLTHYKRALKHSPRRREIPAPERVLYAALRQVQEKVRDRLGGG